MPDNSVLTVFFVNSEFSTDPACDGAGQGGSRSRGLSNLSFAPSNTIPGIGDDAAAHLPASSWWR